MKHFTGYELLWLFFVYSFLGWVLETAATTLKQRKFSNRGLVNGPFCVIYGITAVLMSVGLQELKGIWLFVFAAVYATVAEWISGHLIEKIFHERWWDYSERKRNLDGYICVSASVFWGALGYVAVRFGNRFIIFLLTILPYILMRILLLILIVVLFIDVFASVMLLSGKSRNAERWAAADAGIDKVSARLRKKINNVIERRIRKAYPKAVKTESVKKDAGGVFASGCCFYKIMLLFIIGAFLGDITETIFCRITEGVWMSRSSVVWGPFSIVWGLALALVTLFLYKYKDRSESFLFLTGTLLGGAYEYLCSVFTELVFGKVFWDYSRIPFNLGGRINLLYCFFWGIAAVVWFKRMFPKIEMLIEKIPVVSGKVITWLLLVFMVCNIGVSCMALVRYDERSRENKVSKSIKIENGNKKSDEKDLKAWQKWMDEHYDDAKMKKIYPNAKKA